MSERKVLNKYIPPDFDPSQLKRVKNKDRTGPKLQTVRLMTPFSMRCNTCGEYIYKGKKFNARKEDTLETYGTIKILRFHIKCTKCSASITFRTDPRNHDYQADSGAKRTVEPQREAAAKEGDDETELDRLDEEENAMETLETKFMDQKKDMEIADALDEIRARNYRHSKFGVEKLLEKWDTDKRQDLEQSERNPVGTSALEEDRERAKAVFAGDKGAIVRRLREPDEQSSAGLTVTPAPASAKIVVVPKFVPQVPKGRARGSLFGVKVASKTKLV